MAEEALISSQVAEETHGGYEKLRLLFPSSACSVTLAKHLTFSDPLSLGLYAGWWLRRS